MEGNEKVTKLRMERLARGWSLEEAANKAGYRLHTLAAWEVQKTHPNVLAAMRLAKIYETTVEELFSDIR